MDAKDILGLPKNSFTPLEKKSRPPKESQRKPDGISREVTWQWLPFTSSARKDNLHLYHWVRVVNGVPPTGDYSFANLLAVVQSVDVIKYTDEEYDNYLTDPVGIMSNCTILWNFLNGFLKLSCCIFLTIKFAFGFLSRAVNELCTFSFRVLYLSSTHVCLSSLVTLKENYNR
uniref:SWR1-complex protein 4 n=1 Tax=Cajanus cajan TaxID=3821 RepID=A0A151UDH8_CAJCA